jgi:hypothetical protein
MHLLKSLWVQAQDLVYGIVKGYIISSEELYSPRLGTTLKAIERVSNSSPPEAIEPLQKQSKL